MAFSLPFFKKKQEKHVYFGLYFTESRINGFAFDIIGDKANILSQNGYDISAGYDKMLQDVDNLISDLESKTTLSLDKTIFFLHSTMLDGATHEIKEPYKGILKNISKELELEPMGYIDVHESIEGNLKENSVINNVLLEVSQNQLSVFVYKGGALTTNQTIGRTDSTAADLNSILKALPNPVILPTKVILYGVGDLAKASSDIAQFKWDEKLFVQHPTIEVLKDMPLHQILADTFVEELVSQDAPVQTAPALTPSDSVLPQSPTSTDSQFGFVFNKDVRYSGSTPPPTQPTGASEKPVESNTLFDTFKQSMSTITSKVSSADAGGSQKGIKIAGMIVGTIIALSAIFFGYEYFVHAATVEVTVATTELSEELDLEIPIVNKPSSKELAAIKHTKVTEFGDEKAATGKRDVGEKAKGDIIIHNFDNSEKSIARGTELTYKSLKYVLDSEVKVASSSGISSDGVKQSGKSKASVTSADIGTEYNIAKGSQLSIAGLSDSLFVGIADAAFSGGNKKQVTTISKSDLDSLTEKVEDEVKKKSSVDLSKSIPKDEILLPDLTQVQVADSEYSGEVGEEAKKISIKASSEVEFYTVDKKLFETALSNLLTKEKKESYSIDPENITFKVKEAEPSEDGEEVSLVIQASTKQFKSIDEEEVKEKITFKSVSQIESLLKDTFDIDSAEIVKSTPPIPFFSSWLPLFGKNITVTTSTN